MKENNLWAPWRMEYVRELDQEHECFLCNYRDSGAEDKKNLVLWRSEHCIVVFNRFPYSNGHLLIAPNRHIADYSQANDQELLEFNKLIRDCSVVLNETISPHGMNVGVNLGRCAGAGLPDHLHIHIVPRWNGDTNFMAVCSDIRVISQGLAELYDQMLQVSEKLKLPKL